MFDGKIHEYLGFGGNGSKVPDETLEAYMQMFKVQERVARAAFKNETVQRVLTVLAEDSGVLERGTVDAWYEKCAMLQAKEMELNKRDTAISLREKAVKEREAKAEAAEAANASALEQITQCETPESRDRIRLYRLYVSEAKVWTNENNSMFLQACGAILAGCPTGKLPRPGDKPECSEEEKPKRKARRI